MIYFEYDIAYVGTAVILFTELHHPSRLACVLLASGNARPLFNNQFAQYEVLVTGPLESLAKVTMMPLLTAG